MLVLDQSHISARVQCGETGVWEHRNGLEHGPGFIRILTSVLSQPCAAAFDLHDTIDYMFMITSCRYCTYQCVSALLL